MLRRAPSLARRAAIVFASVYAAILIAVLVLNAAMSWADRGRGNLRGPGLAIDYASAELRQVDGRLLLPTHGKFAGLAARNPAMWLIVIKNGRPFALGAVPEAAARTVAQLRTVVDVVTFRLPGVDTAAGVVSLQRRELAFGPALIAAGGVDPATLSTIESIDMLLSPGVIVMLAVIGVISLLAMLFAIPSFSRALRPVTLEAEAIGPRTPGRRLDEARAPKELLPLVRGFNAALDRLEVELGRRKRFIADVAHELRTPLSVVSLRVEALASEEGKEELRRGLGGLTHLVSQMLDLERLSLSSGERSNVDLVGVARDVVADLAPLAIGRGYDLALDAPDLPVTVTGDRHAIARALTNLIGNAIVHGGGVGQITARVGADRTVDVTDEGPGVPAALQPRLFEPFSRGETHVEGCGLGLHIAREIMRAHGGEVSLVPCARGATFRLAFPPVAGS
jgi:signal transduction histidine kinase